MQMSDTDDVQDGEASKPMGKEPDKEEEKAPEEPTEEPTEKPSGRRWWMWLAVFLVGVAVGALGSTWLL